jgi:RNA polymerase sigma-70 factor (ECF subfamily)
MRDVRGLSYQEISQMLEIPEGTAKSRVNRGRIELVRLMHRHTAATLPDFDFDISAVA